LLFLAASFFIQADEENTENRQQIQSQFSLAVGHGQYGSLLFDGQASPLSVLPRWSLYYKRFYLENLDLGFNLVETEHFSLDLSGKQSFDALSVRHKDAEDGLLKSIALHDAKLPIPWHSDIKDIVNFRRRHLSYLAGIAVYARAHNIEL